MAELRREQNIEYYTSLYEDILKDIKKERSAQRAAAQVILKKGLPQSIEDLLSPDEVRLLRINPRFLSSEEKEDVRILNDELARLRAGGCMDGEETDATYKLKVPGIALSFCFDIRDLFKKGQVNEDLMLANVIIDMPDGSEVTYPLSIEEVELLLGQAIGLGLDLDRHPKLHFPDLEDARNTAVALKYAEAT